MYIYSAHINAILLPSLPLNLMNFFPFSNIIRNSINCNLFFLDSRIPKIYTYDSSLLQQVRGGF